MERRHTIRAFLDDPFRLFFASVAVWGIVVIPAWILMLEGQHMTQLAFGNMVLWHEHEMVFGLILPAICGFLLTASSEWTETEPLRGWPLAALWLLWVAGRVGACHGGAWPAWIAPALNLAFVPAFMADVLRRIVQKRAFMMIPMVLMVVLYWLAQWTLWGIFKDGPPISSALIIMAALLMVIGGKITMTFSRGWMKRERQERPAVRDPKTRLIVMIVFFLGLYGLFWFQANQPLITIPWGGVRVTFQTGLFIGIVAAGCALVCVLRLYTWHAWMIHHEANVLQLTFGLLWVPIALVLLAAFEFGSVSVSAWTHAVAVGGMGTLLVAVMSRVPLAHTGRRVQLGLVANVAFWAMYLAAIIRVVTALDGLPWKFGIIAAGAVWTLAFIAYLVQYIPVFTEPLQRDAGGMLSSMSSQAPECQLED